MSKVYVGIDNGLDGGIGILDNEGAILLAVPMPVLKKGKGRDIDIRGVWEAARPFQFNYELVFALEEASKHSPGKMALCSTWFSYGHLIALMHLNDLRHEIVRPITWQRTFWTKPKMAQGQKFNTKEAALTAARKLWPKERFLASERCAIPHDGIVDALLIAEWARRQNL